jgi:hypothetical protein
MDDFHTSGMEATGGEWVNRDFFFRAKYGKRLARILVWPEAAGEFRLAAPAVTEAGPDEAWAWWQGIDAAVPRHDEQIGDGVRRALTCTLARLRAREPVRIATYGDSIAFDAGNLPLDLALARAWPGAGVEVHTRGRGSAGWPALSGPDVLAERLGAVRPDLVILMNMSTAPEEIKPQLGRIVSTCREGWGGELMLVTYHMLGGRFEAHGDHVAALTCEAADELGAETVDCRAWLRAWIAQTGRPFETLLRGGPHFNEHGRALLLRLFMRHLGDGERADGP